MDVQTWTPGQPLGREQATRLCDPAIWERLAKPRATLGDRPPYIDAALEHCSKQLIVRDMQRDVVEPGGPRDYHPRPLDDALSFEPTRPQVAILSRELATIRPASRLGLRSYKAVRAMLRILFRQPVRW